MISFQRNYFGDSSYNGRECDFNAMDVTYDNAYAVANPSVIFWETTNLWAPNGESITSPAIAPSGLTTLGLPHTPGTFVDSRNFYDGVLFWNGSLRDFPNSVWSGSSSFGSVGTLRVNTTSPMRVSARFVGVGTFAAVTPVVNGQGITIANTGRAGATLTGQPNMAALVDQGATTYSTTQTVRNIHFTGLVTVTGGNVTFEYCFFAYAPPDASSNIGSALYQYNNGNATGNVVCNWCDFDTGLRGAQGNFETCGFQAGQRGGANPATIAQASSFILYRCHIEGFGNGIGIHKWQNQPSFVTECYIDNMTLGGGTHADTIEYYSSDNVTIQRCRLMLPSTSCQSVINIDPMDISFPRPGNPIIIQDNYINGGNEPVLTRPTDATNNTNGPWNVRYMRNYFGDMSQYGRECDFNSTNVTFDSAYALANPSVIFWEQTNVWAPNGEGVTNPAIAPSGDATAGRPHTPGSFVDERNFFGGEVFVWNGSVLDFGGPPPLITPTTFDIINGGYGLDALVGHLSVTNLPLTAINITSGDPNGYFAVYPSSQNLRTSPTVPAVAGTYSLQIVATNAAGTGGPATIGVTLEGAGIPSVNSANFDIQLGSYGLNALIGTVTATNSPTSFSIVSGNSAGYFVIAANGNLSTSASVPAVAGTYSLGVTATNGSGTSGATAIGVTLEATASPANYPTLLNGLAVRPAWQVAGVDFYVGCPAGAATKDPTTQGPVGTNYSVSGTIRNLNITANGVVLDGFDFSLHGGIGLYVGGNNCTIQNCNFVNGTYGGSYQLDIGGTNCIVQNCTVDGSGGGTTWQASLIKDEAQGLLTLTHNWFKNFPQQVMECVLSTGTHYSLLYEYNLIDEGGLYTSVAHLNYLQHANGIVDSVEVRYNTARQVTSVGGEGWQFYMDGTGGGTINNINCHHNTVYGKPQPGSSGGNGVSIASYFHGPNDPQKGPTGGSGRIITNNYVLYYPLVGGFSQSCNYVFYGGSGAGGSFAGFTNSGNTDMFNGANVNLDNTES